MMPDAQHPKRSLLAVASLASALVLFFPPAWFAAIVLGIVALVEIKQSAGQVRGRWMAITGILLSVLWTAALAWVLVSIVTASREEATDSGFGVEDYQDTPYSADTLDAPDAPTQAPASSTTPATSTSNKTPPAKQ